MLDYARDEKATRAAYGAGLLSDDRSYINNRGHMFLAGADKMALWGLLYLDQKGRCAGCGEWRPPGKLDLNHRNGHSKRTRCDCYRRRLNDGTFCNGVELICTLDVRKGGNPHSCHGRRHPQVQWTRREAVGRKVEADA